MPSGIYKRAEGTKQKMSEVNKGKHYSDETKRKMSKSNTGKKYPNRKSPPPFPEEVKKKLSEAKKGKSFSEKHKRKLSEAQRGEKGHNWRGGISPYPQDWTDDLKEAIRKRDNYICQLCGIHQNELRERNKKLDVHHIDYQKDNLNPKNLITLCRYCHCKTNFDRDYWTKYFERL